MKFDLSWFKTIPGLLITGGVVLLIIALIIFIVTSKNSKKEKKNAKEENKESSLGNTVGSDQVTGVSQPTTDNSVATVSNSVESPNINNSVVEFSNEAVGTPDLSSGVEAQPVAMNPVDVANNVSAAQSLNPVVENVPLENNVSTDVEMVSSAPVVETPVVSPSVATISVNDVSGTNLGEETQVPLNTEVLSNSSNTVLPVEQLTPSNDVTAQDLPDVTPISPTPVVENVEPLEVAPTVVPTTDIPTVSTIPTVEPTVVPNAPIVSDSTPTVSDVNITPDTHTIYGGVSQIIPDMNLETNVDNHQIYGGANPLENTQTLPIVDNNTTSVQPSIMPNVSDTPVVSVIPNDVSTTIPVVPIANPDTTSSNVQPATVNNNSVMPTSTENVSVPTGIPAVQVVATAPIMPPENQ